VLPQLAQIDRFADALERHGFGRITIEDISWRVVPSALHSPGTVLWYILKRAWRRQSLSKQNVDTLRGSLASIALGTNLRRIRYYLVTATRQ
jgi:hypothetical protein